MLLLLSDLADISSSLPFSFAAVVADQAFVRAILAGTRPPFLLARKGRRLDFLREDVADSKGI